MRVADPDYFVLPGEAKTFYVGPGRVDCMVSDGSWFAFPPAEPDVAATAAG
jgi:hypothetical protein